ncbi:MAG: hypothetical protein CVV35_00455 [Methanomicrobiales archaeon HGW-Methanomicrobiales-6]|jgi:hypothetical protein|nr:MAG: hypothetical protein CVV35_00455 [Methanomicrobiales archaeon HGW-Methanomicrobiales-6]
MLAGTCPKSAPPEWSGARSSQAAGYGSGRDLFADMGLKFSETCENVDEVAERCGLEVLRAATTLHWAPRCFPNHTLIFPALYMTQKRNPERVALSQPAPGAPA